MTATVNLCIDKLSRVCTPLRATGVPQASRVGTAGLPGTAVLRCLAAAALLGLLTGCSSIGDAAAANISFSAVPLDVMMPPDEYIRPFEGKVTVMALPHQAGGLLLSLSHHAPGQCAIWLPKVGDPSITRELYECLAVIEVANCNGAMDINTPAVKARMASGNLAKYSRHCSGQSWDWAFNAVRQPAIVNQTANASSPR